MNNDSLLPLEIDISDQEVEKLLGKVESGELTYDEAAKIICGETPVDAKPAPSVTEVRDDDIRQFILNATIPQKIKLAMFGSAVARGLLIKDSNKMIPQFVLKNPRLQIKEVEDFTKNPQCPDHVLRAIADRKEWMKSYQLKVLLVSNPKTPSDISMKWLRYLNQPELKKIAQSKGIPSVVATTAKKRLADG